MLRFRERALSDAGVIRESLSEPARFGALVDRHHGAVHRYLHRRVGRDLADDLAAETFARAFAGRERYVAGRSSALPWLYGIATNLVRDHRRSEERGLRAFAASGVDHAVQFDAERIVDRVDAELRSSEIAAVLLALPPAQRDAICLFALADLSYAEIAVALDTSTDAVKALLRRARASGSASLATDPEEMPR
jgi:RNA polymerase sigma-70 factor (ECF subfamily)